MDSLRYHDFHLQGYSVSEGGERIDLDLVYAYPGEAREQSQITFSGVACYSFVHTEDAIITDIPEVPVDALVANEAAFLTENARLYGLRFWHSDLEQYVVTLHQQGLRAWKVIGAVGFYGFVIARAIHGRVAPPAEINPAHGTESAA